MKYSSHTANVLLDNIKNIIGVDVIWNKIHESIMDRLNARSDDLDIHDDTIYYTAEPDITFDDVNSACVAACTELFEATKEDICTNINIAMQDLDEIDRQHNIVSRMFMIVSVRNTYKIIV